MEVIEEENPKDLGTGELNVATGYDELEEKWPHSLPEMKADSSRDDTRFKV